MTPIEGLIKWVDARAHVERSLEYLKNAPEQRSRGSNPHEACVEVSLKLAQEGLEKAAQLIREIRQDKSKKSK